MIKRAFDIFFSLLGLILLSPFLVIIALIIKVQSPGPVFYRGSRVGRNFKPFMIFKFRSMVVDAEKKGGPSTRQGDPRITHIGHFMRRYKIDELPQLMNVLIGEMSLVGPRPEVHEYAKLYHGETKKIYELRPGMTDYASLWNFHEEQMLARAKNTEEAEHIYLTAIRPHKVELQMKYYREMSLLTDLKIIFKTISRLHS